MRTRYTVDEELCIGCGLCHERAPDNLEVLPGEWHSTVVKQPATGEEERACAEAAEFCPTSALQTVEERPASREGRAGVARTGTASAATRA